MQVRPAGQAGYPISLVASLDTVPVKCCVPLHYLKREKREEKRRRKFYIYPDVTHTHTGLVFVQATVCDYAEGSYKMSLCTR